MMKKLFNNVSPTIASAAIIVGVFSIASRIAGFVRDRILLHLFYGQDQITDAYYQALRIPDILLQLFVIGALSASFITIFSRYYFANNEEKAWRYTNAMLVTLVIGFLGLAILGEILAPVLAIPLGINFPPETRALMVKMMRIMFIGQAFFSISMVFGSVLQGAKRFFLYSFAPILNNLGIIFGAIFFVPIFGPIGLAYGTVFGALLHASIQLVGVFGLGYRFAFVKFWQESDVWRSLKQMGPRVMGLAINQVNFLVMDILASSLVAGSATLLNISYALNYFPIGVFAVSYAIAAYPTFCDFANKKNIEAFRNSFSETVRQVMFFIIPITAVTLLLRAQIVRVLYGSPSFDWAATITTANILGFFAISFFAQSLVYVLVRAYFAYEDTVTPFLVGLGSALLNVAGAWIFTRSMGVEGLGLSFTLTAIFQAGVLWALLHKRLGDLDEKKILWSVSVLLFAGGVAAGVMQLVKYGMSAVWELDTFWHVFLQTVVAGGVGLIVYSVVAYYSGSPEMRSVVSGLKRKLLRSAQPTEMSTGL
jgi:putative peptidoglycan lipid II flippase